MDLPSCDRSVGINYVSTVIKTLMRMNILIIFYLQQAVSEHNKETSKDERYDCDRL